MHELPAVRPEASLAPAPRPTQSVSQAASPVMAQVPVSPTTSSVTPQVADDVDLIEKEWVEKAKSIVNQTRQDPHAQNKEMNRFKADYLKKRYNKEIKLEEV